MTISETNPAHDEAAQLRGLQRDARALALHLNALAKLKPNDPKALDSLEQALAGLSPTPQFAAALEELRQRAETTLKAGRATRTEGFRRIEADFVRGRRASGETVREAGNAAWRTGPLELQVERERARGRALYNGEVVVPWRPIGNSEDFTQLVAEATKKLEQSRLDDQVIRAVFSEAYDHLRRADNRPKSPAPRVPLPDFYREVRVSLARHELRGAKPDRRLTRPDFPLWAFLYNLDWYRRAVSSVEPEHRLTLETGSQHDHQKKLAMVLNGLDANEDYKSYCYVFSAVATAAR